MMNHNFLLSLFLLIPPSLSLHLLLLQSPILFLLCMSHLLPSHLTQLIGEYQVSLPSTPSTPLISTLAPSIIPASQPTLSFNSHKMIARAKEDISKPKVLVVTAPITYHNHH